MKKLVQGLHVMYSTVSSSKSQGGKVIPPLWLLTYVKKYTHFRYDQKKGHIPSCGTQHT